MTTVQEIASKSMETLTPQDFATIRREDPEAAAALSARYDKWWQQRSPRSLADDVRPSPSMTALSKKLAAEVQRDIDGHDGETLQEWAKRSPFLPSPLAVVASLAAKITTLEAKVAQLEQRPASVKYCGVWNVATRYNIGDAATFDGGVWIAKQPSVSRRPGGTDSATFWQLAVQRGRPGKPCSCPHCTKDGE